MSLIRAKSSASWAGHAPSVPDQDDVCNTGAQRTPASPAFSYFCGARRGSSRALAEREAAVVKADGRYRAGPPGRQLVAGRGNVPLRRCQHESLKHSVVRLIQCVTLVTRDRELAQEDPEPA